MVIFEFDKDVAYFLSEIVTHSAFLDRAVVSLTNSSLKVGVLMFLVWWCWIRHDGRIHVRAIQTVLGVVAAVFSARILQNNLPHRPRPIHNPELGLSVPDAMNPAMLEGWSSFPSDHAVLVFAITTAIWSFDRRLGLAALLWSTVMVCVPRLYLGLHYVSDVVAGALLGWAIMAAVLRIYVPARIVGDLDGLQTRHAKLFYSAMFLVAFEIATMFDGTRRLLHGISWLT
jgi:undecaprenyl-diphosphatase